MIPKAEREKINPRKLTIQYKTDVVKDDIHNAYKK